MGIGQADTEELRQAVTDGSTQNILYTPDAAQMDSLHTRLAELLCSIAKVQVVRGKTDQLCLLFIIVMVNVVEDIFLLCRQQKTEL